MLAFWRARQSRFTHIFNRLDWPILLPVFLLFPPVLINFQQGQDSLFLLLIMTLAVVALIL